MSTMGADDDFHEEDEDVNDLLAAFESAGDKGKTARPTSGQTEYLNLGVPTRTPRKAVMRSRNTMTLFAA